VHTGLWWRNFKARTHLEDLRVDGRIMFKWIFKNWDGGMDSVDLAQDRDRWRAFVNTVMYFTLYSPCIFYN
jgi:hypothetical protein